MILVINVATTENKTGPTRMCNDCHCLHVDQMPLLSTDSSRTKLDSFKVAYIMLAKEKKKVIVIVKKCMSAL